MMFRTLRRVKPEVSILSDAALFLAEDQTIMSPAKARIRGRFPMIAPIRTDMLLPEPSEFIIS